MSIEFIEKSKLRNSVEWFAHRMEDKLKKNDHKGGWERCSLQYLQTRLSQERKELTNALKGGSNQQIIDECADIANFCMMIAEKYKWEI